MEKAEACMTEETNGAPTLIRPTLMEAWIDWIKETNTSKRLYKWCTYCDIRDGKSLGHYFSTKFYLSNSRYHNVEVDENMMIQ